MSNPRSWALSLALAPVGVLGSLGYGLGTLAADAAPQPVPSEDLGSRVNLEQSAACTAYLEIARVAYRESPGLRPFFTAYGYPDTETFDRSISAATAWSFVMAQQAGLDGAAFDQKMAIKLTLAFAEKPYTDGEVASLMRRVSDCQAIFAPDLQTPSKPEVANAVSVIYGPSV